MMTQKNEGLESDAVNEARRQYLKHLPAKDIEYGAAELRAGGAVQANGRRKREGAVGRARFRL